MRFTLFIAAVAIFEGNASVRSCTAIEMHFEIRIHLVSWLLQDFHDFRLMAGKRVAAFIDFRIFGVFWQQCQGSFLWLGGPKYLVD